LVNHRLLSFHIEMNDLVVEEYDDEDYDIDYDFDVFKAQDSLLFKIPFSVSIKAVEGCENCRLKNLSIKLEGIYCLPEDTEHTEVNLYVPYNCIALLYSMARSTIISITANNPGGPFILPMVDFSARSHKKTVGQPTKERRFSRKVKPERSRNAETQ